jgi:hypothetical protein
MLKFKKINFFSLLSLTAIIFFLIGTFFDLPKRYFLKSIYSKKYQAQMFKCDDAMRSHFISKSKVAKNLDEKSLTDLSASEVSLIDCHDYDKLRKKLLSRGLTLSDLQEIGLLAIESEKSDLKKIIRIHEIRY